MLDGEALLGQAADYELSELPLILDDQDRESHEFAQQRVLWSKIRRISTRPANLYDHIFHDTTVNDDAS
jgi:hypothetical protein